MIPEWTAISATWAAYVHTGDSSTGGLLTIQLRSGRDIDRAINEAVTAAESAGYVMVDRGLRGITRAVIRVRRDREAAGQPL